MKPESDLKFDSHIGIKGSTVVGQLEWRWSIENAERKEDVSDLEGSFELNDTLANIFYI